MNAVISIDPGLKASGIAYFDQGVLHRAECIRTHGHAGPKQYRAMSRALCAWMGGLYVDLVAIEHMETRRGRGDAHAALIDLSHVSAGYGPCATHPICVVCYLGNGRTCARSTSMRRRSAKYSQNLSVLCWILH